MCCFSFVLSLHLMVWRRGLSLPCCLCLWYTRAAMAVTILGRESPPPSCFFVSGGPWDSAHLYLIVTAVILVVAVFFF